MMLRRLVGLLQNADRTQRAKLYTELGLKLDYQRDAASERVHVRSQLSGGGGLILSLATTAVGLEGWLTL